MHGSKNTVFSPDIVRFNLDSVCSASLCNSVAAEYPQLHEGLYKISGIYSIQQSTDAKPYRVMAPCNISLLLHEPVRNELISMEKLKVIERIEPTDWCAPLVPVRNPDRRFRLCVDFTQSCTQMGTKPWRKLEKVLYFPNSILNPDFGKSY